MVGALNSRLVAAFRATLDAIAIDPRIEREIANHSESFERATATRIIAFGKAAERMAEAAARSLRFLDSTGLDSRGLDSPGGIVVAPAGTGSLATRMIPSIFAACRSSPAFELWPASHPYPDASSIAAGRRVADSLASIREDELVLFLISGGGSSLLELPIQRAMCVSDCTEFYRAIGTAGLDIVAVNTLRKHASAIKGGRLAARAVPAAQLTMFVSDVPRGHDDAVASGPTMPDPTTLAACESLLATGDLRSRLPASYRQFFAGGRAAETPKPGDSCFDRSTFVRLLDSDDAIRAFRGQLEAGGFVVRVAADVDDLPLEATAERLLDGFDALCRSTTRPCALIGAGELGIVVDGAGIGGRNQALCLRIAERIAGRDVSFLSAGTDGIDGNSPAAGAIVDGSTIACGLSIGFDSGTALRDCDSHRYLDAIGAAIVIGPTDNNVRDLRVMARNALSASV